GKHWAHGEYAGAVHQPHRGRAAVVLPQNVSLAVAIEVGGVLGVPRGARVGERRPRRRNAGAGVVHQPHGRRAAGVLPQDVRPEVAVEIVRNLGLNGDDDGDGGRCGAADVVIQLDVERIETVVIPGRQV